MKYLMIAVLAISLTAVACEDPAANKTKATVAEPSANSAANSGSAPTNSAVPLQTKGEALSVNSENSKVEFTGSKVTGKHEGGFKLLSGVIDLVDDKADQSSVTVDIDTASVFADDEKLTGHLRSPDFFDVEKYPKASFRSTKIVADRSKGADHFIVTGDFDLHGVTKSISFPAVIKVEDSAVAVNAEFSINRKDFGIIYAGKADDLIRDDVVIRLSLTAPRMK
ncbi:MAG: YceI family protein [Pyrinomonadaceae bacterium]